MFNDDYKQISLAVKGHFHSFEEEGMFHRVATQDKAVQLYGQEK